MGFRRFLFVVSVYVVSLPETRTVSIIFCFNYDLDWGRCVDPSCAENIDETFVSDVIQVFVCT